MNNWNTQWFLVLHARERQQGFLCEAELDHAVRNAFERPEHEARAFSLHAWIGQMFHSRASKRVLGR